MNMFNWCNEKQAIKLNGTFLLTHPETGERWVDSEQAQQWYSDYEASSVEQDLVTETELTNVELNGVVGAIRTPSHFVKGQEIKITTAENTDVTLTGSLAISDETFLLPVLRDDGRRLYFPIAVVDGEFSAVFNFPTSGKYTVSTELLNEEFERPRFGADLLTFYVVRQTANAA
jgi:hypothetical protein